MELDGFLLLRIVPDGHQVWNRAQQGLAGQVIPTADTEHRPQAERPRAQVVVELGRTEIDERRDQYHVRRLLLIERPEVPASRDGLLELA